jgi:uncharacterized membrane protein (DUF373 family)
MIQVGTVLLIAIMTVARNFVLLNTAETSAQVIYSLAAVVVALGATYWLVRDRSLAREHPTNGAAPLEG